ncbi:zinc ABC transporter substrate-binding protein AztC [soil metagenome]
MDHHRPLSRFSLRLYLATFGVLVALLGAACTPTNGGGGATEVPDRPTVVVTYSVLGSVVQELVGDRATVVVLMGDGVDPHDWSPSARDIETVTQAALVVANGLALEEGLERTLDEAEADGVRVFRATDHITIRELEDDPHGDEDDHGDEDPHFWVDPVSMRDVVLALATTLESVGVDVADQAADLAGRLDDLDAEVRGTLEAVPPSERKLVTGHESMGYFADRYSFRLIGAVIPGLTSQGEVSAGELAGLKDQIEEEGVRAIFTEIGTPSAVVESIGRETGVRVVELPSHNLPADGSYLTFIREIAGAIASALS